MLSKQVPVRFSDGLRTRSLTLAPDVVRSIRENANSLRKQHSDSEPGSFSSNATNDALSIAKSLKDMATAKKSHESTVKMVNQCRDALRGLPVETDNPVAAEAANLYRESKVVREASGTKNYAAADLDDVIEVYDDLAEALEPVGQSLSNQYTKASRLVKEAFGHAAAQVENLGALVERLEEQEQDFFKCLPTWWTKTVDVELPSALGKATMSPAEKLMSPNRTASVIHFQLNKAMRLDGIEAEKKSATNLQKHKKAVADSSLEELKSLLQEK